jgi:hypothetical protein
VRCCEKYRPGSPVGRLAGRCSRSREPYRDAAKNTVRVAIAVVRILSAADAVQCRRVVLPLNRLATSVPLFNFAGPESVCAKYIYMSTKPNLHDRRISLFIVRTKSYRGNSGRIGEKELNMRCAHAYVVQVVFLKRKLIVASLPLCRNYCAPTCGHKRTQR